MKHGGLFLSLPVAALSGFLAVALQALAPANSVAAHPVMSAEAQRGANVFASNCAFCHGPTAKGTASGVSLIDSSLVRHDKGGDLIGEVLRDGRSDKGMPPFPSLNTTQVTELAAFLHARIAITDSVETGGPRGGYQLQKLLTGSAQAGKQFFDGQGGCTKCHSVTGDLAGIAKKYRPVELEARFLYPSAKVAVATVTLPSGKVFKGILQHRDPFYISLIDANGHYHSWLQPGPKVSVTDPLEAHVKLLSRYTDKEVHDVFAYLETLQ